MTEMDGTNLAYCNSALALKKDIETIYLTLGEYLYNIKQGELYRPQWDSWEVFYAELKMSQNMVNKLIKIYELFVLTYHFKEEEVITAGGWTIIQEILPVIENKEEAVKWLETAKTLTREDLRKEVKEAKTGIEMRRCAHKNTYLIKICRDCGNKEEVYE